jgi:hypothetical protein
VIEDDDPRLTLFRRALAQADAMRTNGVGSLSQVMEFVATTCDLLVRLEDVGPPDLLLVELITGGARLGPKELEALRRMAAAELAAAEKRMEWSS